MAGFLTVFLGAALGGALRHGVGLAALRLLGAGFPHGTLAVNLAGGFAMGAVVGCWAHRGGLSQTARLFLTTGVLGGFTTFSTFALDAAQLWQAGRPLATAAYVLFSVLGAIGALFAGMALARRLVAPRGR
ncbi:MAG: fluoride efflux transporter CrcB [Rhodovulum sulfidophilum]|uniref:Fluoride-specific ion channel FluC n=1 Tax=Rhodovulum sulfidophilum TaxID=35806 RepID=A0A2W5N6W5_RHOSU|nr:MAG: fluoride efflux transporter CrcB [Rhodovulum sulfidophilum]